MEEAVMITCPYCKGTKEMEEDCKCCGYANMQPCDYCGATGQMDANDAYETNKESV